LLSLLGGAAGILLAIWLIHLFIAISPSTLPHVEQIKLDSTVLTFAFGLSLLTGVLFGLVPGLQSSRVNLVRELKDSSGWFRAGGTPRLRAVLVVSQIALALILLVGAGLLGQTFFRLLKLKPGYDPENLLTAQVFVPMEKYKGKDRVSALYQQITNSIEKIPGVVSAGATSSGPQFGGFESMEVLAEGAAPPPSGIYPEVSYFNIGPNYFHTMGIPVLKGREFTDRDDGRAPEVIIVNDTLARRFWPSESAIGKRLNLVRDNAAMEIVGVAGDVRRFGLGTEVRPEIYFPYAQSPRWATFFIVRTRADGSDVTASLRQTVNTIDPEVLMSGISTMDKRIGNSLKRPRFNLILLGIFAGAALLLAAIGVYGVMSFVVAEQTREIGIRAALGAKRKDIFKLIIGRGMMLALIGVAIGAVTALALTRFLSGLLYDISGTDPITFAAVSAVLLLVVALACYLPARRAMKIDPLVALRTE